MKRWGKKGKEKKKSTYSNKKIKFRVGRVNRKYQNKDEKQGKRNFRI